MNNAKKPPNVDLLSRRSRGALMIEKDKWSDLRAWGASCLFHTLLLVALALLWRQQSRGTYGEPNRPVGIAIADQAGEGEDYSLEGGSSGAAGANAFAATSIPISIESSSGPPISVDNILSELAGNQTGNSMALPGNGSEGSGLSGLSGDGGSGSSAGGRGRGSGNKAKASFFGVEGTGSSFVFVIDRSDSMNSYGAAPLRYAKRELLTSLGSLSEYNQFQIVFYNDSLSPMGGRMIFATDLDKQRATNFVRAMPGDGGTAHLPALKQALAMSPEVLFFLTDADDPSLTYPQLLEIQRRTELSRTTIHAIQFNVGPAQNDGSWIRGLAEMNRGTYKYIDVTLFNSTPGE